MGDETGKVSLLDVRTGDTRQTLSGHEGTVTALAFHPEGKRLASGGADTTLQIWDLVVGQWLLTLEGHPGSLQAVAFSPDGQLLVSACSGGTVRLWDGRIRTATVAAEREALGLVLGLYDEGHSPAEVEVALRKLPGLSEGIGAIARRLAGQPAAVASAPGYLKRAGELLERKDLEGALRALDAADGVDPDRPETLRARADLLARLKRWDRARMAYRTLVERFPEEPGLVLRWGLACLGDQDRDGYLAACAQAEKIVRSGRPEEIRQVAVLFALAPDAVKDLAAVATLLRSTRDPVGGPLDLQEWRVTQAGVLLRAGKPQDALDLLRFPVPTGGALLMRALAQIQQGKPEEARRTLSTAMARLAPDLPNLPWPRHACEQLWLREAKAALEKP